MEYQTVNGFTRQLPQIARAAAILALLLLLAASLQSVPACPFCLSPPQTLAEQMSRADIVVLAELIRFNVYDHGTRPESILRIREYLHGETLVSHRRELGVGQPIVVAAEVTGRSGDLFLMFGTFPEDPLLMPQLTFADQETFVEEDGAASSQSVVRANLTSDSVPFAYPLFQKVSLAPPQPISWNETLKVSGTAVRYLKAMPPVTEPQAKRLEYFMGYLENPDALVAIDAWAEFGNSSYDDVLAVRHCMSPMHLRSWIADPHMSPERLGLYGMMLGLCGTPDDAGFLWKQMRPQPTAAGKGSDSDSVRPAQKAIRYGAEGLMGGYLILTGEDGLRNFEETLLSDPETPDTASHAIVQSLQFMWSYESDIIGQDRVRQSMRLLLKNTAMREIAITNLSRWEDWESLPTLITMFEAVGESDRSTQRAILQFAQNCMKFAGNRSGMKSYASDAEFFICGLHASGSDLMRPNHREFQSPQ